MGAPEGASCTRPDRVTVPWARNVLAVAAVASAATPARRRRCASRSIIRYGAEEERRARGRDSCGRTIVAG
ncbi:MAG: hypothetical protein ACK5QX_08105 [bacterium]